MKKMIYLFTTLIVLILVINSCTAPKATVLSEVEDNIDTSATSDLYADIGNKIWLDENGDGIKQKSEPGFPGVYVYLYVDSDRDGKPDDRRPKKTYTNSKGYYRFNKLEPYNNYIIQVILPDGYKFSSKHNSQAKNKDYDSDINPDTGYTDSLEVSRGRYMFWVDAALKLEGTGNIKPASVGDKIWLDTNQDGIKQRNESGLKNIRLYLWLDTNNDDKPDKKISTTTTNSKGNYRFKNLNSKLSYYVEVVLNGKYDLMQKHNPNATGKDWDSDFNPDTGFTSKLPLESGVFSYWLADGALVSREITKPQYKWFTNVGRGGLAAIETDNVGNLYAAGYTSDSLFGEAYKGEGDAFIVKYDDNGGEVWHKWLATPEMESVQDLAIDKDGNLYLIAYSRGKLLDKNIIGYFIAKYDNDGNLIWYKTTKDIGISNINDLGVDGEGNIYVSGYSPNGGEAVTFYVSQIAKLDNKGNKIWKIDSYSYDDYPFSMAVDFVGNVYLSGYDRGEAALAKYDKDGNKKWQSVLAGKYGSDLLTGDVATDNLGNVYWSGQTKGPLFGEVNRGGWDAFIIKYDKDGNKKWYKWLSSTNHDRISSLDIDDKGNIYATGDTKRSLFDEANKGEWDTFLVKYDKNGYAKWHKWIASEREEFSLDVVTNNTGDVYLSVNTLGDLFNHTNTGFYNTVVIKYKQ